MKFYYTGSPSYNAAQISPSLSLGGFLSSSEIPNDRLNNLFTSLSELSRQNLTRQSILIALKNNHNEVVQNITLRFDTSDWSILTSEYSIAFILSKIDSCGNIYFDSINDIEALPYLEFETISETNNEFSIGDMARDQIIGIWLSKKILKDKVTFKSCASLYDDYLNNVSPIVEENFSISLEWSDDESGSASS